MKSRWQRIRKNNRRSRWLSHFAGIRTIPSKCSVKVTTRIFCNWQADASQHLEATQRIPYTMGATPCAAATNYQTINTIFGRRECGVAVLRKRTRLWSSTLPIKCAENRAQPPRPYHGQCHDVRRMWGTTMQRATIECEPHICANVHTQCFIAYRGVAIATHTMILMRIIMRLASACFLGGQRRPAQERRR